MVFHIVFKNKATVLKYIFCLFICIFLSVLGITQKTDSLPKYTIDILLKKSGLDLNKTLFVTEARYRKIADSLKAEKLFIQENYNNYSIPYKKLKDLKSVPKRNALSIFPSFYYNMSYGDYEPLAYCNYFTYKYSKSESDTNDLELTIQQIYTTNILWLFSGNEIGNVAPTINDELIDAASTWVYGRNIKEIALALTKPWKKEAEKVRAIYSWIRRNINYDHQGLISGKMTIEAAAVFNKRIGVCQGFANLFSEMCAEAGLTSIVVMGIAKKEDNKTDGHAWNAVQIDNKWFLLDATWGDRYYLIPPKQFIYDHYPDLNRWTLLTEYYPREVFLKAAYNRNLGLQ